MTTNADVLAMLAEMATLTRLDEETSQSFKVRAYESARLAVEAQGGDVTRLSQAELQKIKGVGKAIAAKIRELVDTGAVAELEVLRAAYPPAFVELSRIPGLGPKTLKQLRSQLGVADLDGLKAAIEAEQVRTLPRMGATSEAKLAKAIERLGLTGKDRRTPVARARPLAERLVDELRLVDTVQDVLFCGSLRRMAETVGDIDITVAATRPDLVMAAVRAHPAVHEIVVSGDTKTSFLTAAGAAGASIQVDVRVVSPEQLGAATLYFTGSKAHNIELRQRAIDRGWLLNEYGLLDAGGAVIASRTEAEIYQALGLTYVPPPMREATGEVEAAARGDLPEVVQLADIRGDLHYHTDRSGDGRAPLEDMVKVAADRGYSYLAITDHGEDLAINGSTQAQMVAHRDRIRTLQEEYPDLRILFGCELNIGADGGLDYDPDFRREFDYTVASVHSHFDGSARDQTARLVKAIADPTVDSIGHLTGRYIGRRPGIELDIDIVLEALHHFDVALEINGALDRLDAAADVVRRAVERGVKLVINTDSHHTSELGRMEYGVLTAQRGWVPRDQVINTWDRDRFLTWVATHRENAPGG
ncbi:MAG: DNA polymerase/3'-5' exonuclease PolX [Acidimicrobiia bacterium]|nr:DNA polymerase/3'-5' exonuclease PolX [Acidimicrobiia bacterium]MDH5289958.1 DNA polymerase/3'-5' exonuclease PolX [Acidimicrobiia bacterium]